MMNRKGIGLMYKYSGELIIGLAILVIVGIGLIFYGLGDGLKGVNEFIPNFEFEQGSSGDVSVFTGDTGSFVSLNLQTQKVQVFDNGWKDVDGFFTLKGVSYSSGEVYAAFFGSLVTGKRETLEGRIGGNFVEVKGLFLGGDQRVPGFSDKEGLKYYIDASWAGKNFYLANGNNLYERIVTLEDNEGFFNNFFGVFGASQEQEQVITFRQVVSTDDLRRQIRDKLVDWNKNRIDSPISIEGADYCVQVTDFRMVVDLSREHTGGSCNGN